MIRLRRRVENLCHKNKLPFSPNSLGGACGICSFLAFRILKRMRLRPVFHINKDHAFLTVVLSKKHWLDLTLTQFVPMAGLVFLEDHPYPHCIEGEWIHRTCRRATTEREIRKLFSNWPDEQNPFKQKLPKISI
jgi:hypothetical protein